MRETEGKPQYPLYGKGTGRPPTATAPLRGSGKTAPGTPGHMVWPLDSAPTMPPYSEAKNTYLRGPKPKTILTGTNGVFQPTHD